MLFAIWTIALESLLPRRVTPARVTMAINISATAYSPTEAASSLRERNLRAAVRSLPTVSPGSGGARKEADPSPRLAGPHCPASRGDSGRSDAAGQAGEHAADLRAQEG